eukprot:8283893-Alexandrium_andersonii.AAC.1
MLGQRQARQRQARPSLPRQDFGQRDCAHCSRQLAQGPALAQAPSGRSGPPLRSQAGDQPSM